MKKSLLILCFCFVSIIVIVPSAHANLISNGSFESGNLSGWTARYGSSYNSGDMVVTGYGSPSDGIRALHFNGNNTARYDYIWQNFDTVEGQKYKLEFDFNEHGDPNKTQTIRYELWDGTNTYVNQYINSTTPLAWITTTYTFTAQATSIRLLFQDHTGWSNTVANDGHIDRVSVNVVPEPATMFLLGSGLIGLAGFRRKNKKHNM